MICRLVLSLRKATGPNVIKAWNVDHFSIEPETRVHHGVALTPLRFHPPTIASSERGVQSEESRLTTQVVSRSPPDSGPHDAPEETAAREGERCTI